MTIAFICAYIYYHFKYRYFKVIKATRRNWGVSGKEDLTTYRIQVLTKKTSEVLKLDELWIDNRLFRVRVIKKESNVLTKYFSEKETLYLEAERETKNIGYEEISPSVKGKVSVGYLINNKRKYLTIKGFEEHSSKLSIAGAS